MGGLEVIEGWECRDLEVYNTEENELYYYVRKMKRSEACVENYNAHIFLSFFLDEETLRKDWEQINDYVAVHVQSKVDKLIEKSNFYLCLYVAGEVSCSIKEQIEGDSFSAKKYIFNGKNKSIIDCCDEVEHRIFSIDMDEKKSIAAKLTGIELQNFRVYEDNFKVNFQDKNKLPASLVAIYAKNGVGKTSLFDGVEYALKGEIGRLEDLKEKGKGAIFHNRNHASEDAYVKLKLDNGKDIQRNISKVAEQGNDCRRNPPIMGKELVGEPERWNQIILPHDKIDTFVSAKKPTERYKEWVKSTDCFKTQDLDFIETHRKVKATESTYRAIETKIEELSLKVQALRQQETGLEVWKTLIQQYNEENQNRQLKIGGCIDGRTYDSLRNLAFQYMRELEEDELKPIKVKVSTGEKILSRGVSIYQDSIASVVVREKALLDIEDKIKRRSEYNEILLKCSENQQKLVDTTQKIAPIGKIEAYGKEIVLEKKDLYERQGAEIERLQLLLESTAIEERELQENILQLNSNIAELKKKIAKENVKHGLKSLREQYDSEESQLEECEEIEAQLTICLTKILVELQEKKQFIQRIREIYLPEEIGELRKNPFPDLMLIFKSEKVQELQRLCDFYENNLESRERWQKKLQEIQMGQVELEELCNLGRVYLNKHQEADSCPLCHTPFESWEVLFRKVNEIKELNQEFVQDEIEQISRNMLRIAGEYAQTNQEFEIERTKKLIVIQSEIQNLSEQQAKNFDETTKIKSRRTVIQSRHDYITKTLIEAGVSLEGSSEKASAAWLAEGEAKLNKEIVAMQLAGERQSVIAEEKRHLEELRHRQKEIVGNLNLFQNVKFLSEQSSEFDLEKEKQRLNEKLTEIQEEAKQLNEQLAVYKDVNQRDVDSYLEEYNLEKILIQKDREMVEECSIFPDLREGKALETQREWKGLCYRFEQSLEKLRQICEENGARVYFEEYRVCNEELKVQKERRSEKESEKTILMTQFEEKRKQLEEKLKTHFSQTIINEIFRKISPHQIMRNIDYKLSFNDKDEPELSIEVKGGEDNGQQDFYRPEWFFSSAQLNTVAFSSFFSRALQAEELPIKTIFIDDPVGHFDDINILGFADLLRSVLENYNCQIVISTHDEKVFRILERKLNSDYYSSCFINLPLK